MRTDFANEMEELKAWVDAVRPLPRFLRTKDARVLMDALEPVTATSDGLAQPFDSIAERLGRSRDELLAALRRCPFGVEL
jgi:hypothetical protein